MKSILAAATLVALGTVSASAADMAARPYTKAPAMAPMWDWSGFYIGGNVGYGISRSPTTNSLVAPTTPPLVVLASSDRLTSDGVIGGGQIGWNKMFAPNWLFGIEADIQAADQKGSSVLSGAFFGPPAAIISTEARLNWFGTVRGRLGWTATPDTLLYVTGGYAYGEIEQRNFSSIPDAGVPFIAGSSVKSVKDGWTVGGGVETHLWNSNWTAKAEYLYMDLGTQGTSNFAQVAGAAGLSHVSSSEFKDHIVRVGVNYKLGNWFY